MKQLNTSSIIKLFLSIALLVMVVIVFDSCGGGGNDPGPAEQTPKEKVTALLASGQWKIKSLMIDGVAKSSYPGLAITFGATGGYSSTGGTPVWPTSGTWAFTDDTATAFKRDDQVVVTIESIDQGNLKLALDWSQTSLGPGRVTSVTGKHEFTFGK
ncbi:MAG: hypothetical protein WDO14_14105 [Bacteroidota bacterium]